MKRFFQKMNRVIAMIVSIMMVFTAIPQSAYVVLGEELEPTITFDANGGVMKWDASSVSSNTTDYEVCTIQSFRYFESGDKPGMYGVGMGNLYDIEPTKEGYEFAGWFEEDGNEFPWGQGITSNIKRTYFAKWEVPTSVTFESNGGVFPNVSEKAIDHVKDDDENIISQSFKYFKKDNGRFGANVGYFNTIEPTREGYIFNSWISKEDKSKFDYGDFESKKDRTYEAKWIKTFDKMPVIDTTYGKNGILFTKTSEGYVISAKVKKEDFSDIVVGENEVLKLKFEFGATVPIIRNNDTPAPFGYYIVWNGKTLNKDEDAIVEETLFTELPTGDQTVHVGLQYIIVEKDSTNNPESYIYNDWSNVNARSTGYGNKHKLSDIPVIDPEKAPEKIAGGDVVDEDKSYDGVVGFERTEFTKDTIDISDVKPQIYTGDYLRPNVSVKFKQGTKWTTLVEGTDYIKSYSNNLNAGTATITVTGSGLYKGTYSENFTINPKNTKKLKATAATVMVNDSKNVVENSITVYDGLKILEKGKDYQLVSDETSTANKGKTYIKVKGLAGGNYSTDELKVAVSVIPSVENAEEIMIRSAEIAPGVADSLIYKGSAYKAADIKVVVKTAKGEVPDTDYKVSVKNTKDVGTGYITVKAKGKTYKGSVTIPVEIKAPAADKIELSFGTSTIRPVNYNGKLQRPKVTVKAKVNGGNLVTLKLNKDYKLIYENNLNATTESSKAKVRVVGIGNYATAPEMSNTFEIKPISIGKVKGTGTKEKGLTLTFNKHQLVEGVDYKLEWKEDMATATKIPVVVTGLRNFTLGDPVIKAVKIK